MTSEIIANSGAMREVLDKIKRLSSFSTTVLVSGESGTGKELIARHIHESSPRRDAPFIAVNCGAIPETLIESELFGHTRGAFTDAIKDKVGLFEEAHGGTLFLDEIGELPLHLQVKLLRALQEQKIRRVGGSDLIPIDLRVIAATHRDLEADVKEGKFREDLFYRLNVVSIHLTSLRERPEDIPHLIEAFLTKHSKRLGLQKKTLHKDTLDKLYSHQWKGNIRELENCIERALVLSEGEVIMPEDLPDQIKNPGKRTQPFFPPGDATSLSIRHYTEELERYLIIKALERTKGNRTHAAKILEISHRALLYKLKEYGLGAKK